MIEVRLDQNNIDIALNKWRTHLRACVQKNDQYFIIFVSSWTNENLDKLSAKVTKTWTKCAFVRVWVI